MAGCLKEENYGGGHMLGKGGYATIFKGKLMIANKSEGVRRVAEVAIKQLEKLKLNQCDETISMDRELQIQKRLDHPNVVKLLHFEDQHEDFL